MKTFSCTIQKKLYAPPVMNNAKKIAIFFSPFFNRFFSIFSAGYFTKVINFARYKQDVDSKRKRAYYQPFTSSSPVDKLVITGGRILITHSCKKKRIFFSTVSTAYHHHHRDLKRKKRNKIFNDKKLLSMEKNRSIWKKVLKIAGIVVLVLLLAFGGLVGYAYYTYKKDNSRTGVWYYANELPLTPDQYAADFDEIHQIVVDNYSLYRQKGLDMDSLYRVFAPRIGAARQPAEYVLLVQEYIAALGAGHATSFFSKYTAATAPKVINDSLFISNPNEYLRAAGFCDKDRITAINGIPVGQWVAEHEKYACGSTASDRHYRSARSIFRSYVDTLVSYTVQRGTDTLTRNLPLRRNDCVSYEEQPAVAARVLDDSIGYLAINTMMPPVMEEFATCYPTVSHLPYLIVDVRDNGGGSSANGALLCEYFINRPQLHCLSDSRQLEPAQDAYRGKVFLLTGPDTFSAAESFTLDMKESGNVTLVGEPTAGDTGNGPKNFCTSHGIWLRIPTREPGRSHHGFPLEGEGIVPHYVVPSTVADFMHGRDTQIEFVRKHIAGVCQSY